MIRSVDPVSWLGCDAPNRSPFAEYSFRVAAYSFKVAVISFFDTDGGIEVSGGVALAQHALATGLLSLVGLDKPISIAVDENGKQVALDRVSQRMEVWGIATEAKSDVDANPGNDAVRRGAVRTATAEGFFSIWMIVFDGDVDMRNRLIDAFSGTRGSGCFDAVTAISHCPAPNPDLLANGSKL